MNLDLKAMIVKRFGCQSDFAVVIKTDESIVSRVVRGRRQLSQDEQKRWASLLGCKPAEIFGDK